jgi:hypothetical protein
MMTMTAMVSVVAMMMPVSMDSNVYLLAVHALVMLAPLHLSLPP